MTALPAQIARGMIHREHSAQGMLSRVWYSACESYRYGLSRVWDKTRPAVLFVMLNPSTADEHRNDPTVARCETRARRMGFGGLAVANLFAFRATRPADLKRAAEPVGPLNDAVLAHWAQEAEMVIAAWGVHGAHAGRAAQVAGSLPEDTRVLGLTRHGHPRHPLYVAFDTMPANWPSDARYAQA